MGIRDAAAAAAAAAAALDIGGEAVTAWSIVAAAEAVICDWDGMGHEAHKGEKNQFTASLVTLCPLA